MSGLRRRLGLIAGLVMLGLAPATAAHGAAAPSAQDTQFLQAIHQVNLTEIQAGDLAQQKASNQQVKELGKEFATDHKQLDQKVQSTASSVGVNLPKAPSTDQQAVLNQLKAASGTSFDTEWVTAQLVAHRGALGAVDTELSQGSDPSVVQVAQEAQPVLRQHYDELVTLAQSLGIPIPGEASVTPSPSGSSGSPRGNLTPNPGNS